jgi:hypothetical protein
MPRRRTLRIVVAIVASFAGLVGAIIFLSAMKLITFEVAKLMVVAVLAMYVGFGVLIAVYRLIAKLE